MYNIKFTCKALTGDTVHSVEIDDSSLSDTWHVVTVGEIPEDIKAYTNYSHDINVWFDTNDDDRDELHVTLYDLKVDENQSIMDKLVADDVKLETDFNNYISCEIIEVTGGNETFTTEDTDYFYIVSNAPTYKEREFEIEYIEEGGCGEAIVEIMALSEEHARIKFAETDSYSTILRVDELVPYE